MTKPAAEWFSLLLDRFEVFRQANPGLPGLDRTTALVYAAAGDERALEFVNDWIVEVPDDPEALLARTQLHLQGERADAALDSAMAFVQQSANRKAALREVADMFERAADTVSFDARKVILRHEAAFRELLQ